MSDEQQPYVPAGSTMAELTVKAVVLGVVLAAIMGAANAYLALKAGQTVSATFPAAILALAAFRLPFFRGTILEQNIARAAGTVGEALAAGAIFTIPAFLLVTVNGQRLMMVGGTDGVFHALQVNTGKPVWNIEVSKRAILNSVLFRDNIMYLSHGEENIDTTEMGMVAAIDATGTVGPIGRIRQKLFGAKDAGASAFLAPQRNCGEVVGHVPNLAQVEFGQVALLQPHT